MSLLVLVLLFLVVPLASALVIPVFFICVAAFAAWMNRRSERGES